MNPRLVMPACDCAFINRSYESDKRYAPNVTYLRVFYTQWPAHIQPLHLSELCVHFQGLTPFGPMLAHSLSNLIIE
jgi:hypothetical protein